MYGLCLNPDVNHLTMVVCHNLVDDKRFPFISNKWDSLERNQLLVMGIRGGGWKLCTERYKEYIFLYKMNRKRRPIYIMLRFAFLKHVYMFSSIVSDISMLKRYQCKYVFFYSLHAPLRVT